MVPQLTGDTSLLRPPIGCTRSCHERIKKCIPLCTPEARTRVFGKQHQQRLGLSSLLGKEAFLCRFLFQPGGDLHPQKSLLLHAELFPLSDQFHSSHASKSPLHKRVRIRARASRLFSVGILPWPICLFHPQHPGLEHPSPTQHPSCRALPMVPAFL